MSQDTQEHEDHVDDIQRQSRQHAVAIGDGVIEIVTDVHKTRNPGDRPQDLGLFHGISGNFHFISADFLIFQQSRIHSDRMLSIRMGCDHDNSAGCNDQNHQHQVHREEDRLRSRNRHVHVCGVTHRSQGAGRGDLQRNRTRQTRVPHADDGISRSDQNTVVDCGNLSGHFFRQQNAGNQAKAPVQPHADTGNDNRNQDTLLRRVSQTGTLFQQPVHHRRLRQSRTQHNDQAHLHGKCQQAPETAVAAPIRQNPQRANARADHRRNKDNDCQNNCKQECIRQPSFNDTHRQIGDCFHKILPP